MSSSPPNRPLPLPELPSKKRRRPASVAPPPEDVLRRARELQRSLSGELSISASDSLGYESTHKYLCTATTSVPEDLAPLRREMLAKIASTFGVPKVGDRTTANLCILVGSAIEKARAMEEIQGKVSQCLERLTQLRRKLDAEQVPDFLRSEVEDNFSELEQVYQQAERKFRDINVSVDAFERDVARRIRQCDSELDTVSRKFLTIEEDSKKRRRRRLWQK